MVEISVSLWSADLANLDGEIRRIDSYADRYHIDVADGHYAPILVFFPDLIKALRPLTQRPFEVHLICERPEQWIDIFAEAGADTIIFYLKTAQDIDFLISQIRKRNMKAGIALSLEDEPWEVEKYLDLTDMVVVLGTNVGIKGVGIHPGTYDKIRKLKMISERRGLALEIEADGGIRKSTVPLLTKAGASVVVAGSLIFNNPADKIYEWLKTL